MCNYESNLLAELRTIASRQREISFERANVETRLEGCGILGIAVDTDPLAIQWQAEDTRKVEILKELRIYGI